MAATEIGKSSCTTKKIKKYWYVEQWEDGEACVAKCENLAKQHGPGCCEAQHLDGMTRAYCTFGEGRIEDVAPTMKAVLCTKLPAGT